MSHARRGRLTSLLFATAVAVSACEPLSAPEDAPLFDLVFEGRLASVPELLVFDQPTAGGRRLLPQGTVVMDPEPSPDGSRIAFVVADYSQSVGDIFVMNRDGTNVVQLTTDPELDDQPSWSPDGTRIVFRSFREQRDGDIYVMNADGSNQVNLYPDPVPALYDLSRPSWSPNGARIAFSSNEGGTYDIWTMRPDGSDRVRITDSDDLDVEPSWSPDGTRLVFRRTYLSDNESDLFTVPARDGLPEPHPIEVEGQQRLPRYTPDGMQIVFVNQATVTARPDLYIMATDGSSFRSLVTEAVPGGSLHPAFMMRRGPVGFGLRP
jgi:Tol biopolymer transport system component